MIHDPLLPPSDASAPDADRAGPAVPEHLARLLFIVRVLLHAGRHLAALIERRTARRNGLWLFSAIFGTGKQAAMRASLHRGILRAAALESLLLKRAATGRDVSAAPRPMRAASHDDADTHPCHEPFQAQIARLTAERAQFDAPADPRHPATAEAIEAEVLASSIARTIDGIRRDLGIVAMMCTGPFWDAMTDAIACYQDGTAAECLDDTPPEPGQRQQAEEAAAPAQLDRSPNPYPRRKPWFNPGPRRVAPLRARPASARPHDNVRIQNRNAAAPAATGPPPRARMWLAA